MILRSDGYRVKDESTGAPVGADACVFEFKHSDHPNAERIVGRLLEVWRLATVLAVALERRGELPKKDKGRAHYNAEIISILTRMRAEVEAE